MRNISYSWKGQTFAQVLSCIKFKKNSKVLSFENIYNPPSLKIYRKEIEILTEKTVTILGATNVEFDRGLCESFSSNGICLNTQKNALNRIRTSGIIKNNYSVNNKQYLEKRCMTFQQNQSGYLVKGDSSSKPGSATSVDNIYSNGC